MIKKLREKSGETLVEVLASMFIFLILFGILLCLAEEEINRELFHSIGYFPFALIGAITGIAGLVMVFYEKKDDAGK